MGPRSHQIADSRRMRANSSCCQRAIHASERPTDDAAGVPDEDAWGKLTDFRGRPLRNARPCLEKRHSRLGMDDVPDVKDRGMSPVLICAFCAPKMQLKRAAKTGQERQLLAT